MDTLSEERVRALLEELLFADIAVVSDGAPYVTPVSFVRRDEALFFRCGPGERVEALRSDPRACLSLVRFYEETGEWESVIVRGEIEFIDDSQLQADVTALLLSKYRRYEPAMGVALPEVPDDNAVTFSMRLDDVTGRSSGRSIAPRTRPGRL